LTLREEYYKLTGKPSRENNGLGRNTKEYREWIDMKHKAIKEK